MYAVAKAEQPQFIEGMFTVKDDEYWTKAGISNSSFRLLSESAIHLENEHLFRLSGGAFTFGSALHTLILEPEEFDRRFVVEDFEGADLNKNSNAYKDAKRQWESGIGKRDVLDKSQMVQLKRMVANVEAIAGPLLKNGVAERAIFAEINGVQCKGKFDYYREDKGILIDVKTTQSIRKFPLSMIDYNYVTQCAFYTDIMKSIGKPVNAFVFILVETTAPYMVRIAQVGEETIEEGRAMYGEYLEKWKLWQDEGISDINKTVNAPEWWLDKRRGGM